jgi:peptidoglycan/LPS O-acetylase OafA/YrhL
MEPLFPAGSDGVDIFFVISSFTMAYTMSRPDQRSQSIMDLAPHTRSTRHHQTRRFAP